MWHQEIGTE